MPPTPTADDAVADGRADTIADDAVSESGARGGANAVADGSADAIADDAVADGATNVTNAAADDTNAREDRWAEATTTPYACPGGLAARCSHESCDSLEQHLVQGAFCRNTGQRSISQIERATPSVCSVSSKGEGSCGSVARYAHPL